MESNKNNNDLAEIPSFSENRMNQQVSIDIVIPVYNEEETLGFLFERLNDVFSSSNREKHQIKTVRYILIDDGSSDKSSEIICGYIKKGISAVLYRFSRNFGHQNAVSAGLENAEADVVAVIDADLQDPPEVILQMLEKWREGFDVVYGERKKRKENFIKVAAYWFFYRIVSFLAEVDVPLDSGDFSLLDKKVIKAMQGLSEKLRIPRMLRAWVGFRQTGLPYERPERVAGETKYSFSKLYRLATDGITSISTRPLKISQLFSVIYLVFVTILVFVSLSKFGAYQDILQTDPINQLENKMALWFLLTLMLVAFGSFVQIFCIYVLSSYVARSYFEIKRRPSFVVMEVIGKEDLSKVQNEEASDD